MIVIADDITGAAEIAGIAFSQGQQVRLLCSGSVCGDTIATNGTTVIATDTRSMTEDEAMAETRRIASQLPPLTSHPSPLTPHLFKKTDSALRGHVIAELSALMEATGCRRAVFLPANPSKGRVIRDGVYYINDTPIADTDFRFDPEFPAKTSVLKERFPDAARHHIFIPDAESEADIKRIIATYNDGHTLFAGAADLFTALLFGNKDESDAPLQRHLPSPPEDTSGLLILCGSTQSKPQDIGIPISPMPREVYDGQEDLGLWDTSQYAAAQSLILTIPYTHRTGKTAAVHLRTMMAAKAKALISQHRPSQLIIEGGATAWATLQALGWTTFEVVRQIAPGVVQLRSACGTLVTLKPGSYPWNTSIPTINR
ncbi:MAG: hypothetical protein J6Z14_07640 [Prevotella sp.]|nr:hypothetical protein [Prevotella sp.]